MGNFYGWDMPLHYGSQIQEHHRVRKEAGMFDVSHMTVIDFTGAGSSEFLRHLLANDVARLSIPGKALYSCMLNERGGVIDDLIVYYMDRHWFRMVTNAATRAKDRAWIERNAGGFSVAVEERNDLSMVALQGPEARAIFQQVVDCKTPALEGLAPFQACILDDLLVARTGYTGEDGYEFMAGAAQVVQLWDRLVQLGVWPVGLGARDTLRLEAGMSLYGMDMTEDTTPLQCGLAWTIAWEPEGRKFIGRAGLERWRGQAPEQLRAQRRVGLVLDKGGVLRPGQKVFIGHREVGIVTSGGFSPTLGKSIALARISGAVGDACAVEIRGARLVVAIVKPPFVRNGRSCLADLVQ